MRSWIRWAKGLEAAKVFNRAINLYRTNERTQERTLQPRKLPGEPAITYTPSASGPGERGS